MSELSDKELLDLKKSAEEEINSCSINKRLDIWKFLMEFGWGLTLRRLLYFILRKISPSKDNLAKSFQDIDKLRGQMEFIEDLPKLKARKTASVKALTQKLINTPIQRWGVGLTQQFEGLGNKLQRAILRRKEKKGN